MASAVRKKGKTKKEKKYEKGDRHFETLCVRRRVLLNDDDDDDDDTTDERVSDWEVERRVE